MKSGLTTKPSSEKEHIMNLENLSSLNQIWLWIKLNEKLTSKKYCQQLNNLIKNNTAIQEKRQVMFNRRTSICIMILPDYLLFWGLVKYLQNKARKFCRIYHIPRTLHPSTITSFLFFQTPCETRKPKIEKISKTQLFAPEDKTFFLLCTVQ